MLFLRFPTILRSFSIIGDITNIPFKDQTFDVVTTVDVLEHISPESVSLAIKECARVAKVGIYHEVGVLEDIFSIHHYSHFSQHETLWWLSQFETYLEGWEIKRGLKIPVYKNGIFILKKHKTEL